MIVRILVWNVFDSKTTIDELRESLPELEEPNAWIWNEASERFGLVAFDDALPEAATEARALIGADPEVFEEYDVLELSA